MRLLLILLTLFIVPSAMALDPSERLDDPALEERARELSKELRCLVCQNQSIDESDADLAKDLRVLVRERLVAGDTNKEVLAYLTDRYGAFIRLTPPFNMGTLVLWVSPFVVALLALASAIVYVRARRPQPVEAGWLTAEEEAELKAALAERTGR